MSNKADNEPYTENASHSEAKQPYLHPAEHLVDLMKRLDLLIHLEILRDRKRHGKPKEWIRFAAIADEEVGALLQTADIEKSTEETHLLEELAKLNEAMGRRVAASQTANIHLPLSILSRIFRLSPLETEALVVSLAPEIDRRYERLYGYLQDDMTRRRPSIGLILSLCLPTPASLLQARSIFSPSAPLIRYQLLYVLEDASSWNPTLSRPIRVDDRILSFLLGENRFDAQIQDAVTWALPESAARASSPVEQTWAERLIPLIEGVLGEQGFKKKPILYLSGREEVAKRTLAQRISRHFGLPLLVVDAELLVAASIGFEGGIFAALREGLLQPAAIYIEHWDRLLSQGPPEVRLRGLSRLIEEIGGITFLSGERPHAWPGFFEKDLFLPVGLLSPEYAEQREEWRAQLKGNEGIEERDLSALASKYRLSCEQIADAMGRGEAAAALRGESPPTLADIEAGCRAQNPPKLGKVARKIETKYTWKDIVLPPDQMAQLHEICSQVEHRSTVYGAWGFDRKLSLGKGLNVLFSGPPGTGKTMAAEVIANALRLDLHKINLSQVVSKYIGETEKSLDRIFTAAERSSAILFFDEADALFGKRSEVRDSHDRYANIEIGYLLQKMEEYEGVAILATNLRQHLDEAFVRRLHVLIEFPFPDEEYRRRIWESIFTEQAPLGEEIDWNFLARKIRLAGGNIKNIALAAAFYAAEEGGTIRMGHLLRAARREHQKLGRNWDVEERQTQKPACELRK